MSQWFDQSNNANKLRQSYLKGFLDISGGGVFVRADNSLNFYTQGDGVAPKFKLGAEKMTVINPTQNGADAATPAIPIDVPTSKLAYMYNLDENIKSAFAQIRSQFQGAGDTTTTNLTTTSDANIGGKLFVGDNAFFARNVDVTGNLTVNQNLNTKGNGFFGGNLTVDGDTYLNSQLFVKGDAYLEGRLFVTQDASFWANIASYGEIGAVGNIYTSPMGDLSSNRDLRVAGNTVLNTKLTVGDIATIGKKLTVQSQGAEITGDMTVASGNVSITGGNLSVSANATISEHLTVAKDLTVQKRLFVTETSELTAKLTAKDDVEIQKRLFVTKEASFSDDVTIAKRLYVTEPANLTADLSVANRLFVTKAASFSDDLSVAKRLYVTEPANLSDDLSVAKRLFVTQDASFSADVAVANRLFVSKTATIGEKLTVTTGGAEIVAGNMAVTSGNLSVSGIATIGEKLTVTTGGAEIVSGNMAVTSGNLSVSASASVGGNLAVTGKITCDSIQIGGNGASDAGQLSIALDASFGSRVYIHDNVYMDADNKLSIGSLFFSTMETAEPNTIGTTAGNLVIHPADSVNDWTVIKSNLKVDGKVNFTGDFIRTDTIVNVTEQFDISNSGTGPALKVTQWDQQSDVASFRYDSSPILLISANNKVGINIPLSNNINYHLDVSGNAHVSSTMKVDGKLTLMNDLEITGHYLSAAGNITLTDGKLTTKTMQVTTTSDFDGLATFKSGIRLMNGSQVTYFDQSDAAW
jgi:predicted acyltransferase (DUF342 family)